MIILQHNQPTDDDFSISTRQLMIVQQDQPTDDETNRTTSPRCFKTQHWLLSMMTTHRLQTADWLRSQDSICILSTTTITNYHKYNNYESFQNYHS